MQPAYDRMQAAYDRMHPACRLHTIVCMGSTLKHTRSGSHLWIGLFITNGLLVDLSISGHSQDGCCWHRSCRYGLLFRGNGRSCCSPQTTSSSLSMGEVLDYGEAYMWRITNYSMTYWTPTRRHSEIIFAWTCRHLRSCCRTASTNFITSHVLNKFAIFVIFADDVDVTPTALRRHVEWACQITSWLKIEKYDRKNVHSRRIITIVIPASMGEARLFCLGGGQKGTGSRARGQGVLPLPSLPFPFFLPRSYLLPSLSPFFPSSLRSRHPQLRLGGLGECSRSPSGSGLSPAAKRLLTHFLSKFAPFWVPHAAYWILIHSATTSSPKKGMNQSAE